MKKLLIINPSSGQRRAEQQSDRLAAALETMSADIRFTEGAGDAEQFALEAIMQRTYDTIVAVGGDGTVNEVINGILRSPRDYVRPAVGIIPLGTSNILATELGIPLQTPADAAAVIAAGGRRMIDIGRANGRYFTMMASFGWDAEAVKRVQPNVKELMGAPAYILSGIEALAQYRASIVDVTIDNVSMRSEAFMVVVANTSSYAIEQVKIAPFASIDDGWFDICIFERPPTDKIGFIGLLLLLMARRHLGDPRVRYYRGKKVTIAANPPMLGQIDGDLWRETPTTIEILPRCMSFFVP